MVIFTEVTAVSGSWDIVLFSRAVKTCGLHRRGNWSCGRHIVYALDSRRRIIWLALCVELLRKGASSSSNSAGLRAERLTSNSAAGLTNDLRLRVVCGFGQSWESPLIWALWVFVITSGSSWSYLWESQVLMHAVITWFTPVRELVGCLSLGLGKVWSLFLLVSVSCNWPKARNIYGDVCRG